MIDMIDDGHHHQYEDNVHCISGLQLIKCGPIKQLLKDGFSLKAGLNHSSAIQSDDTNNK